MAESVYKVIELVGTLGLVVGIGDLPGRGPSANMRPGVAAG